ncbi:MAG: hypothetical protein ACYS5W_06115 [Planctomycetota bacterium]|jgi:uncharacterized membrane protein YqjE
METLYFYCAVVGGAILVLQTVLLIFAGTDTDVDADVDVDVDVDADVELAGADHDVHVADASDSFVKLLSFKTIVAFLTFFGLTGLACLDGGVDTTWTFIASMGAGVAALYIVAWLMTMLWKLRSEGNEDLRNAVGSQGKVYLRVPGNQQGIGKVTVTVQGRQITRKAVTAGDEIPTGTTVSVVDLSGDDTLKVEALSTD